MIVKVVSGMPGPERCLADERFLLALWRFFDVAEKPLKTGQMRGV